MQCPSFVPSQGDVVPILGTWFSHTIVEKHQNSQTGRHQYSTIQCLEEIFDVTAQESRLAARACFSMHARPDSPDFQSDMVIYGLFWIRA